MMSGVPRAASAYAEPILIGQTQSIIFLPSYVANDKNFFADEGLDVDLRFFRSGTLALAVIASGDAKIYVGVPSSRLPPPIGRVSRSQVRSQIGLRRSGDIPACLRRFFAMRKLKAVMERQSRIRKSNIKRQHIKEPSIAL